MWLADLLSIVRIPLGGVFILVASRPVAAVLVLVVGAVTDMVDGWVARRAMGAGCRAPHRGDWLDPLCDKIFVACVMVGLYLTRRPPVGLVLLVLTRELLQTAFMAFFVGLGALVAKRRFDYQYRAHPVGKLTTVVQFAAALALLFGHPAVTPLAWVAFGLGLASAGVYLARAVRRPVPTVS